MSQLSIRLRLVLTLVVILGTGGAVQAVSYFLQHAATADFQEQSARVLELRELGDDLEAAAAAQRDALSGFLLTGDLAKVAAYDAARIREAKLFGSAARTVAGYPELGNALPAIEDAGNAWRRQFADPSIELMLSDRQAAARSPGRIATGDRLYGDVVTAQAILDVRVQELNQARVRDLQGIERAQLILFLVAVIGAVMAILVAIWLMSRWVLRPLGRLLATARRVEAGEDVEFRARRDDEIGRLGGALERMRRGLLRQATQARVVNQFTEAMAFAESDGDVARAAIDALGEIVSPADGVIHIANRSKDRALPEGSIGDVAAGMIALGQMQHCPGVRRSSLYVTPDLSRPLGVHCPVHPGVNGTLACIPLVALGEVVGAVHLHWAEPDALPLDVRGAVTRITEHAALAIANRRLMTALQGMASTDSRTGLPNSRAFDEALETRLADRHQDEPLSVLMLDIDHFKAFNDRNGHPAGDQALRAFAQVLRGCVRDVDLAARYGGEEFAVMLPGSSAAEARVVAERIRAQADATAIDLSPGHRDRFTVSIGVASWPADATDRVDLLEVADAALYRAKNAGRNRVVVAGDSFVARAGDMAGDERPAAGDPDPDPGDDALPPPVRLPRAG